MKLYVPIAAYLCAIASAQQDNSGQNGASAATGCSADSADVFNIMVDFDPTSVKRDFVFPRQDASPSTPSGVPTCTGAPVLTLKGGVLTDQLSRICSIVHNHQFQCDPAPGQVDALATSGWQICNSDELLISSSTNFNLCKSRDAGTGREFFNIYDNSLPGPPPQCTNGIIKVFPCSNATVAGTEQKRDMKEEREVRHLGPVRRDILRREYEGVLEKRTPFPLLREGGWEWDMQRR